MYSRTEITDLAAWLTNEAIPVAERAAQLDAWHTRGETAAEIAALVEYFLAKAVPFSVTSSRPLLDVCGTGGDHSGFFNVSTTVMFVAAACGAGVVKHGNRGITSKSGGADALEALGLPLDLAPDAAAAFFRKNGFVFLFAPAYHPAFKAIAPVRKFLSDQGKRSVFNILGPLLNPARPDFQMAGVFHPKLLPLYTEVFQLLGRKTAWTVSGALPDEKGNLPGGRSDLPGGRSDLPSGRSGLPGGRSGLPGGGSGLPGGGSGLPGGGSDLPSSGSDLPSGGSDLPSSGSDLPGGGSDLPGGGDNLPIDRWLDELSTLGPTHVSEWKKGAIREFEIDAQTLGLRTATMEELQGGHASKNAYMIEEILCGENRTPCRDLVLLNAAAALNVVGLAADLNEGIEKAADSLDSGAAWDVLEKARKE